MIKELILTSLLSVNVAVKSNSFNNSVNTQESNVIINDNAVTITIEQSPIPLFNEVNASYIPGSDMWEGWKLYKYTTSYNTIYANILMNTYCTDEAVQTDELNEEFTHYVKSVYVMQITPYLNLSESTNTLTYTIDYDTYMQKSQIKVDFYTTKQQIMANFLEMSNWSSNTAEDIWGDIENQMTNKPKTLVVQDILNYPTKIQDEIELDPFRITIENNQTIYVFGYMETECQIAQSSATRDVVQYISKSKISGNKTLAPTIEVIDLPDLLFTILTMPFSFISQAFNLTLFVGTPYQINISNLFLGIIGIAFFLWILKLILGKADFGDFIKGNKNQKSNNKKESKKDDE